MLAVCVACSPVQGKLLDAHDFKDSPLADAPTHGMVTVTVLDPAGTGVPAVGLPVVFVDPTDTVVAHPTTDAMGKASADVPAGSSVTVVETLGTNSFELVTLTQVKPGDNLLVGRTNPDMTSAGTFTISFVALSGATNYQVVTPCGTTFVTTPGTVSPTNWQKGCTAAPMEVMVVATDASNNLLGSVDVANVTFVAGGTQAMPTTYSFPQQLNISLTNISNVSRVVPRRVGANLFSVSKSAQPTGAQQSLSLAVPTATATVMETQAFDVSNAQQVVRQPLAGNATAYGLDFGNTLLSWLGTPMFTPGATTVAVPVATSGTTGATPDAFVVETFYSRMANGTTQTFTWLVASPTYGNITLPTMPAAVGDVNPKTGDNSTGAIAIAMESDQVADYDAARANIFKLFDAFNTTISNARVRISVSPNAFN